MSRKPYVLGFIVCLESNEVLLIKKTKPQWQAGYLNGIGGKIELTDDGDWERADVAMSREAEEECGVGIKPEEWQLFAEMSSDNWVVWCYITAVKHDQFKTAVTKEAEEVVVVNLSNVTWQNYKLLGNIAWLVNMGLDKLFNPYAFTAPTVMYHSFSFPLIMPNEEKDLRLKQEHAIESKWTK